MTAFLRTLFGQAVIAAVAGVIITNLWPELAQSLRPLGNAFIKLIPTTIVDAFASEDVLQVLLFAILFGSELLLMGERAAPITLFVDALGQMISKIMSMLIVTYYLTVAVSVFDVLGLIMRLAGFSLFKLLKYLRAALTIVFATTSSDGDCNLKNAAIIATEINHAHPRQR
jgi:Na+/H+-dicarboxylate symporter